MLVITLVRLVAAVVVVKMTMAMDVGGDLLV